MRRTSTASTCLVSAGQWRTRSVGTTTNEASAHRTPATSALRSAMLAGGSTSVSMPTSTGSTTRYDYDNIQIIKTRTRSTEC